MTKHKSKMKTLKQSIHFSLVCFSCFLLTENWLTSLVGWLDTWVAHKLGDISPRTFEIIEDDDQDEIRFAHVKEQRISVATVDNRIFLVFFIQKVINGNICFDQKMVYCPTCCVFYLMFHSIFVPLPSVGMLFVPHGVFPTWC